MSEIVHGAECRSEASRLTRVLLVDDSADIRDLFQRLLNRQADMKCVDARESTVGLEEAVRASAAEIAIVDLVAPGRDSIEAIQSTSVLCPWCRIIAFSGYDDPSTREQVARAGAWLLVSKHDGPMRLLEVIRRVVGMPARA